MGELANLKPELLWKHFEEICKRPHPSRKEKLLAQYVVDFAKKNNLDYAVDKFGNAVVRKPATKGFENLTPVVLQGHLDMVAEKNADVKHDFDKDPIQPYVDGDWVKAKGTTLGSDNGIGVAAALAVLEDKNLQHGPIEALFTLDEETGLNGAQALQPGFIHGEIMMNLDSEEDGALYIGCAGGQNSTIKFNFTPNEVPANTVAFDLKVTGLKGGHSGLDIHLGKGNAIKLMVRLLHELNYNYGIRLVSINGGSKHNAIPRECFATIRVAKKSADDVKGYVEHYNEIVKAELASVEPTLNVVANNSKSKLKVIDITTAKNLIDSLYAVPNGVIKMSADIPGLVETSTNLATINYDSYELIVGTSQRSSIESAKRNIARSVQAVFELAGAKVKMADGYPGWQPNFDSPLLQLATDLYKKTYGQEPEIKAVHAGLECGILSDKYPGVDMISFGPIIIGAHSPDEKVNIDAVIKFYSFLKILLHELTK